MRRERGPFRVLRIRGGQALRCCVRARRGRSLCFLDPPLVLGRRLGLACRFVVKELKRLAQTLLARFGPCLPPHAGPLGSRLSAGAAFGTAAPDRTGEVYGLGWLCEHLLSPRVSLGGVGLG